MKKIVVLLMLLTALVVPIASATTSEVVWREHPTLAKLGIYYGDVLRKVTYDDGTFIYSYVRGTTLKPAFIASIETNIKIPVGGYADIPITLLGISSVLDGASVHNHDIVISDDRTGQVLKTETYDVNSGKTYTSVLTIGQLNTEGTYKYRIQEYIYMSTGAKARGDSSLVTITVGNPALTSTSTATATATPPSSTGTGQISVSSNVAGSVYIDGSYVGITGNTFTASGGGHSVKVTQTGYNDYITSVTVASDRTSSVTATLTAASTSGDSKGGTAQGYIIVWSSPSEAKVYVNDVEKGTTGAQWLSIQMPVGTYTVKLVKGEYEAYSQSVTVVANDNAKVEARMTIISLPGKDTTGTGTGTPVATSGMAIETPAPKTMKGGYECPQGTVWNADRTGCIALKKTIGEKIDQLPGFEALFAIAGLVAVAYLVLRQKEKKKKDNDEE